MSRKISLHLLLMHWWSDMSEMLLKVVEVVIAASFLRKEVICSFRTVWSAFSANFVLSFEIFHFSASV